MVQYWSVVGQLLVSRWSAEGGVRSLVSNPWQFVIDTTPISLTVHSVIMLLRDRLESGWHLICWNNQWYKASLWLDYFGHCLSPPSCSIGTQIVLLVLYTQNHVAGQPLTVCCWYYTNIFDCLQRHNLVAIIMGQVLNLFNFTHTCKPHEWRNENYSSWWEQGSFIRISINYSWITWHYQYLSR